MPAFVRMKLKAKTVFSSTTLGNVEANEVITVSNAYGEHLLSIRPVMVEKFDSDEFREPRVRGRRKTLKLDKEQSKDE